MMDTNCKQQPCHMIQNDCCSLPNTSNLTPVNFNNPTSHNGVTDACEQSSVKPTSFNRDVNEYNILSVKQPIVPSPDLIQGASVITPPPAPQLQKVLACELPTPAQSTLTKRSAQGRLNKFVRRLHEMLLLEQSSGIVEWRKGLLVLHSTDAFTKKILPKYFGTKNFKTFRRQLNYYGFVHVRSFSATGSTTTALWVNQDLAKRGTSSISSVLMLKRVEPSESSKTAEGRRVRKEEAASTVEDIGINTRTIQIEQIRNLAAQGLEKRKEDKQTQMNQAHADLSVPVPISTSSKNCQQSQTGTESTSSNLSSHESSETSMPVPVSIKITVPLTNNALPNSLINTTSATSSPKNVANILDMKEHHPVSITETSTDDAANLLMLLSRSSYQIQN